MEADIVCLQEVAGLTAAAVAGLGYRFAEGAARRSGGLDTLLHTRLLVGGHSFSVSAPSHGCLLRVSTIGDGGISVGNLHLVPSLSRDERHSICVEAVVEAGGPGRLARLICGDLNSTLARSWLATALRPGGVWAGWRCPYKTGVPTNVVMRVGSRRSAVEIDWILISHDTPCQGARRFCLPGLCTHLAVQCDLDLSVSALRPTDPSGRQFAFSRLAPAHLPLVGEVVGLTLWWAVSASLEGDAVILAAWEAMRGMVPRRRRVTVVSQDLSLRAAEDLAAAGGCPDVSAVRQWWDDRSNEAFTTLLRLERHRVAGVNITSQTGHALRLTVKKVQSLDRVSADGIHFPDDRAEFLAEVHRQGREPYGGRAGLRMDVRRLAAGASLGAPFLRDTPDFETRMRSVIPGSRSAGYCVSSLLPSPHWGFLSP